MQAEYKPKSLQNIADKWAGEPCTLNGMPATITGRLLAFGRVRPLDTRFGGVEYSWETIDRIMDKGGAF